jgi:hypothetical protein
LLDAGSEIELIIFFVAMASVIEQHYKATVASSDAAGAQAAPPIGDELVCLSLIVVCIDVE